MVTRPHGTRDPVSRGARRATAAAERTRGPTKSTVDVRSIDRASHSDTQPSTGGSALRIMLPTS